MSKEVKVGWRKWSTGWLSGGPHFIIGSRDNPYLHRWYIIPRNPWLNVYLHKFLRDDEDRALHDHPWWFVSLMLKSGYDEVTPQGTLPRAAPSICYRPALWRHRVVLKRSNDEGVVHAWTLVITGRKSRNWGCLLTQRIQG